jgi:hypothetical protein
VAPVVPSERPWATQRPVPVDDVLLGRHVGVVSVARRPSRLVPLPWAVAQPQGTCAACVALALGGRAYSARIGQARQSRIAPQRPADASLSVLVAGGKVELGTDVRREAWHASGFGQGVLRALRTLRPLGWVLRQPRVAPQRPADASLSALIAGGKVELGTNQGGDMRALELRVAASQVHTDSTPMDAELLS